MDTKNQFSVKLSPEYVMGGFTTIDNIYICEYMKNASNIENKVYMFALYLANSSIPSDISTFTSQFSVLESEVINAFIYWQEQGLVDLISEIPLEVVFHPISNNPLKPRKIKAGKYDDFNKSMQSLLSGRMISPNEYSEYYNIIELFHMQPEALISITAYCVKLKGNKIGVRYITQTAKNFAYKKILTLKGVDTELAEYELQSSDIACVVKTLGLRRKTDISDNNYYKKWKKLGFDKNALISAAKLKKGKGTSLERLDLFLMELYSYKKFSSEEINEFDRSKKEMRGLAIDLNRTLSIYLENLDPEINTYILKWIGKGYSKNMLIRIADFCFKNELRSLSKMDSVVQKFSKLAIFTENDFDSYIQSLTQLDNQIAKLHSILGINRHINSYDRKQFKRFIDLGFTSIVILYAGELSINAQNPYPYMNSILSKWKNANKFTLEEAKEYSKSFTSSFTTSSTSQTNKQDDYLKHNYTKEQLNAVYATIDDLKID